MSTPISVSRRRVLHVFSMAAAALPFTTLAKDRPMRRIFITGSTDGLGHGAAEALIDDGHQVVLHARSKDVRQRSLTLRRAPRVWSSAIWRAPRRRAACRAGQQAGPHGRGHSQRRHLPRTESRHDAGGPRQGAGSERARALHVDPPHRAARPAGLSQQQHAPRRRRLARRHRLGHTPLGHESRLLGEQALHHRARLRGRAAWPRCEQRGRSRLGADKMGGRGAPDDLEEGHLTQTWLATSDEPAAKTSGRSLVSPRATAPGGPSQDTRFQDQLLARLAELTGIKLF